MRFFKFVLLSTLIHLIVLAGLLFSITRPSHADGLQWEIPGGVGSFQLPTSTTDIIPLVGYDAIKKQVIAGASTSLLTILKELHGYVGAVGEWQSPAPNVQPYLGFGADVAQYIPGLNQVKNMQVQAFVRYVASTDKHLGAGGALAYKF